MSEYVYKYPQDLNYLELKRDLKNLPIHTIDQILDKLSTPQMLALFFNIHEQICPKTQAESV